MHTQVMMNRRNFLRASAVTVVTAALATAPQLTPTAFAQSGNGDIDILNYALTLEHLEARAYAVINDSGLLTGKARDCFMDFGAHEAAHVVALTDVITQLGGTPVPPQASYTWPTFQNAQEVLTYFQMVEELGAAAYLGQAPRIQNPDLLTAAVSIHNVEGQHAAILSDLIGVEPSLAFAAAKSMEEVLAVVTPILMPAGSMPKQMPNTGMGGSQRRRWALFPQ
ncbi:MAG: ferritin-like domain-containing protein [Caldilineaceae bacterium]|nr:ferritin-like domain-containing protein [Caldilineaceae bacterium]